LQAPARREYVASSTPIHGNERCHRDGPLGADTVRGFETSNYRAAVHLTQLGASPEKDRYPVEVWVDEDGRTRRYRFQPGESEETYLWKFYDFGIDVELTPPPPDGVR
jgi:hypothetical protein